ncbi:MAG TPA: ABC transporter substrate-binding protein, partial [Atribacterota bacterium]|nr:ABC transporter substrate-binding protein [Atribacterota bacterium]
MKKFFKVLLIVSLLFSLVITITLAKDDTLDNILKTGVVKVGFCVDVPPIKFRDKNNEPAGICVGFAEALARELGVKLEYVFSDWAGLIPTLLSGRSDVIITDMSTTLERAKKVNFTQPWMVTGTYIVVRGDSEWTSWKDMNKKEVEIGCILGTIGEQNIK